MKAHVLRMAGLAVGGLLLAVFQGAALAQEIRTYSKKGSYDDVRFELTNGIINRGLTIDYNGFIGRMLERTGSDVGSSRPVYKSAEFFSFCSASLSRKMMEADPMNIGFCPYVVFVYESVAEPGQIIAGYRRLPSAGSTETKEVLAEVDALLDGIVRQAMK